MKISSSVYVYILYFFNCAKTLWINHATGTYWFTGISEVSWCPTLYISTTQGSYEKVRNRKKSHLHFIDILMTFFLLFHSFFWYRFPVEFLSKTFSSKKKMTQYSLVLQCILPKNPEDGGFRLIWAVVWSCMKSHRRHRYCGWTMWKFDLGFSFLNDT